MTIDKKLHKEAVEKVAKQMDKLFMFSPYAYSLLSPAGKPNEFRVSATYGRPFLALMMPYGPVFQQKQIEKLFPREIQYKGEMFIIKFDGFYKGTLLSGQE